MVHVPHGPRTSPAPSAVSAAKVSADYAIGSSAESGKTMFPRFRAADDHADTQPMGVDAIDKVSAYHVMR
jgi:hypothetical protein